MRHLLLLIAFSLSMSAQAKEVLFRCITDPATTSFEVEESFEGYKLRVLHHNGVQYMPLFEGVLSPWDLPQLQKKAERFQKMGALVEVDFPTSSCQRDGTFWKCYLKKELSLGELPIHSVSFSTQKGFTRSGGSQWNFLKAGLSFQGEAGFETMAVKYSASDCKSYEPPSKAE